MVKAVFSWFTELDIQAKIIMAFFALALVGIAIATMVHVVDTLTETAEQKGAVVERAQTQGKVIENVRKAKDAADAVRRDGPSHGECLQDSRVRENC